MQFLKSKKNGHIYHTNPILAKRTDMVPCDENGRTAMDMGGYAQPEQALSAMTSPGVVDAADFVPPQPEALTPAVDPAPETTVPPQEPVQPPADQKAPGLLSEDAAKAKVHEWFKKDVSKVTIADLRKHSTEVLGKTLPDKKMTKLEIVSEMARFEAAKG